MVNVAIAVPLETELVERIRAAHPDVHLDYRPQLLPPRRFPSDHTGGPAFTRSAEGEKEYWDMLLGAEVLYGFPNESPAGLARIVRESTKLRWIQAMAAGAGGAVRQSGLTAEELADVLITTSAGVHALPLAEFAMMGVLEGLKDVPKLRADQETRTWPVTRIPTRLAHGAHLVITGLGEIGQETARLAKALGMKVSGTKRNPKPIPGVDHVVSNDELPQLLHEADALVNTLPGTPSTDNLFDAELFAAMKPGIVLVNVGRGTVIDEQALLDALANKQVSYACLDVFAVEPLPQTSPLWSQQNVLISPHTSALSAQEAELITERFIENLSKFERGESMPHEVDVAQGY